MKNASDQYFDGITKSGFTFRVEKSALDDYELLEELTALDQGHLERVAPVIQKLLGQAQTEGLKEHCRNAQGRVTITAMKQELEEIFKGCSAAKN